MINDSGQKGFGQSPQCMRIRPGRLHSRTPSAKPQTNILHLSGLQSVRKPLIGSPTNDTFSVHATSPSIDEPWLRCKRHCTSGLQAVQEPDQQVCSCKFGIYSRDPLRQSHTACHRQIPKLELFKIAPGKRPKSKPDTAARIAGRAVELSHNMALIIASRRHRRQRPAAADPGPSNTAWGA